VAALIQLSPTSKTSILGKGVSLRQGRRGDGAARYQLDRQPHRVRDGPALDAGHEQGHALLGHVGNRLAVKGGCSKCSGPTSSKAMMDSAAGTAIPLSRAASNTPKAVASLAAKTAVAGFRPFKSCKAARRPSCAA
jgi:hypothetical protein